MNNNKYLRIFNERRKWLAALGASLLVAPLSSFAQQQNKIWRVGFLNAFSRPPALEATANYVAFSKGMRDLGYVEGKNLLIEWRFGGGKFERLSGLATELVQLKVDVIVAQASPAVSATQKVTTTIPIVMVNASDPVGSGFVASLARPGGNTTALTNISGDISSKHLEMLLGMVPKLSRVAVMVNPANSSTTLTLKNVQAAAATVNVRVVPVEAGNPQEIEIAFSRMSKEKAQAVIVARDPFFGQQKRQVADLAIKHRLPSVFGSRDTVEVGGLMGYGSSSADDMRRAAIYVDKIFKGAKPADLPVEQPTIFEMVINRKTAKALGLAIPQALLISANEVIE